MGEPRRRESMGICSTSESQLAMGKDGNHSLDHEELVGLFEKLIEVYLYKIEKKPSAFGDRADQLTARLKMLQGRASETVTEVINRAEASATDIKTNVVDGKITREGGEFDYVLHFFYDAINES